MARKDQAYQIKRTPKMHHVIRFCYSLLVALSLPILIIVFRKKLVGTSKVLAQRQFSERFGVISSGVETNGIHIHCVSVGEVNAASGLINALIQNYGQGCITLTTTSTTGAEHALKLFKDKVYHTYLPIDLPFFMNRFYTQLQPRLVLVTEVEIWPNMLAVCAKKKIPCVLINGRMSDNSLNSYRKLSWLFRHSIRQFSTICAQSSQSFANFLAYGVYKKQLKLSNNMKFDLLPEQNDLEKGKDLLDGFQLKERPILLAGSTHDPEEQMILKSFQHAKQAHPKLVLVIVPRHPHRFDEAQQIVKAAGLHCLKLSELENTSKAKRPNREIDVLIINEMGWLKACYSICDIAFVGGSFAKKGGHNALEAALYSKPIVMGPSIYNNPLICQYLAEQQALKIVDSQSALNTCVEHWLSYPKEATEAGEKGVKVLLKNAGAIEYTLDVIRDYF